MIIAIVAAEIISMKRTCFGEHNSIASGELGSVIPALSKHSSNV
jgi:hypothetical protein